MIFAQQRYVGCAVALICIVAITAVVCRNHINCKSVPVPSFAWILLPTDDEGSSVQCKDCENTNDNINITSGGKTSINNEDSCIAAAKKIAQQHKHSFVAYLQSIDEAPGSQVWPDLTRTIDFFLEQRELQEPERELSATDPLQDTGMSSKTVISGQHIALHA